MTLADIISILQEVCLSQGSSAYEVKEITANMKMLQLKN